ncbi:helix-turn-helix transcriptional regulator [Intrasporangium calvum]|uniref:Transcriptional regulator n=1 Tax=Intrasporangium calvum (strain ATCC 23552 / DSM 43043 / JCM 3097 / NBRC 12989 / NCIMB 10167 / NRRL B-3866 / 7 KIP) TaxID=710696 RepID=E6SCC6_INTC7|nr:helix-turn-helix domain-containing protein [Intrasporangium calvum]ADU48505.1 putative transcriptional regulator [Intrasporangium calvum DSM 43043]
MSIPPPDGAVEQPGFGPSRARVLAALRELGGPATAAELAGRLGTHPNTARFHLEALCVAGVVSREREDRTVPGRPRTHYVAGPAPGGSRRSYRLLAEILAAQLGTSAPDPGGTAARAGRAFGRAAGAGRRHVGSDLAAAGLVVDTLSGMGFTSLPSREDPDRIRIDVTSCPFLEVATQHLDVVCAVHRGLMEGLLEATGAPLRVASLEPLVRPTHCVAHLERAVQGNGHGVVPAPTG